MQRTASKVLISASVVLLSCGDHDPTGRASLRADGAHAAISDASTGGRPGFYFLAPIITNATHAGKFDPLVAPTVEICVVAGATCATTVARYSMSSGPGSETVRLDAANELYTVVWHTSRFALDHTKTYRIRVLLWDLQLGYADVDLVSTSDELKAVQRRDFVPLIMGASLPVKFRIEESALWAGLPGITLSRSTAPPGATVEITGFSAGSSAPGQLTLGVASHLTPVRANGTGALVTGVPLFLGPDLWPAPPAGPQHVVLLRNGIPVAGAQRALTVTPLPDAPGSSQRALSALETLAGGFSVWARDLPAPASAEAGYYGAITGALVSMVGGNDARSLKRVLQNLATTDPRVLRLLDAWLASSGAVNVLQQYASYLTDMSMSPAARLPSDPVRRVPASRLLNVATASAPTTVADTDLAIKMQLYEVVKLFSETVISGTNTTFSNYIANLAGFIAFTQVGVANAPSLTPVAITAALLAMADFVANKLIVALMPAKIVTFDLSVADTHLDLGELTDATLRIVAANDPPTVGINDVVGLILNTLGALPAPDVQTLTDGLKAVASFYLNLMQSLLSQYAAAHPGLNLDVTLGQLVPVMQWETVVRDRRLVERKSQTPAIIDGDLVEVNWRASQNNPGEGRIYAQPTLDPTGVLIDPPGNIIYTGGSFGDDILSSNVVTVQVGEVNVTVTPGTASVLAGGMQAFQAVVTGTNNTAVTWSTDDPGGFVTSAGVYTAGTTAGIYAVTATSVADPTKSGAAAVQVADIAVSISPQSSTLMSGTQRQFQATVTGAANTAVSWSATGGSITSNGLYTAGAVAGDFTITARSVADPAKYAEAAVTVTVQQITVSVSPGSATLMPGEQAQFQASVSGTANAAVTWSSTGGTTDGTGNYTAGGTPGDYLVIATSVASPDAADTAFVTILPPPPVTYTGTGTYANVLATAVADRVGSGLRTAEEKLDTAATSGQIFKTVTAGPVTSADGTASAQGSAESRVQMQLVVANGVLQSGSASGTISSVATATSSGTLTANARASALNRFSIGFSPAAPVTMRLSVTGSMTGACAGNASLVVTYGRAGAGSTIFATSHAIDTDIALAAGANLLTVSSICTVNPHNGVNGVPGSLTGGANFTVTFRFKPAGG